MSVSPTSSSTTSTSATRITGLATGMDTDTTVKQLMQPEQDKLDKLKQSEQKYTWQSDAYRQWNSDLFSYNSTDLYNMKLSSSYQTFNVSSSNSTAVSGTATSSAISGSYSVKVNSLAVPAGFTNSNLKLDSTKSFGDQGLLSNSTTISITTAASGSSGQTQTGSITINASDTINDLVSKLNSAKDSSGNSLGLQAIYDKNLNQFILRTKTTGNDTQIDLSANTGTPGGDFLKNALNFGSSNSVISKSSADATTSIDSTTGANISTGSTSTDPFKSTGANANIDFNGTNVTSLTSNSATLMGIDFTFSNRTLDSSGNPSASTVTVTRDIDTEVKNIENFVSKYNDILGKLNSALDEPVYSDYQPLTDAQRSQLSDTQITQWETKAKSGLLHGDSILSGLVNQMRSDTTAIVSNGSKYNSLASIGISSKSYTDKGKLYVDEDKLRAALQDDPDAVNNLFTSLGGGSSEGIINRISDHINDAITKLTAKAGMTGNSEYDQSYIGKILTQTQTKIDNQQKEMTTKENNYYKQFADMEAAVSKYNSQNSYLSQALLGGQ